MDSLRWSWLAAPYAVCSLVIVSVALAAALIRGDRVMRLGVVAAATTALPWATSQAFVACTTDPVLATKMLRIGQGVTALIGPNLMLVLLATSGQLERYKWFARIAGLVGGTVLAIAWSTPWVVPGVQMLSSGMYYMRPGPATSIATVQLPFWLGIGIWLVRRSTPIGERRRNMRLILGVLVCGSIGSLDTLVLYRVPGTSYPIAWFSATLAASIALYLVLRTDFIRPQGFDSAALLELLGFMLSVVLVAAIVHALDGVTPVAVAIVTSAAWTTLLGIAWATSHIRPVRVASDRALEQFVTRVVSLDDEAKITERLGALWQKSLGIAVKRVRTGGIDAEVAAWFVRNHEALAVNDLATMRLGALRPQLEALGADATLLVPLVDRGELAGLVEASYDKALRDTERGLISESARAAARALTFVGLSRAAQRERETAREVEVADALRLQASASREAELGKWAVAAEYRTAPRTTGAGWSAIELDDGRLALLVTEAHARGVPAAFATAAMTGAFAAAMLGSVTLDGVLAAMQVSSAGVIRGGEPVRAFIALIGSEIEWACAGHPGAVLLGDEDTAGIGPGTGVSAPYWARGTTARPAGSRLVVASLGLRGDDDTEWAARVRSAVFTTGRLASVLVEDALRRGAPTDDLLAVIVRAR